jgi:type III secretion protein L
MGLAFLITSDNLQILSERKVLKEAEYSALLEASSVIDAARTEAARMARQAGQLYEEKGRQGYQQGMLRAQEEYAERLCDAALGSAKTLQAMKSTMADIVVRAVKDMVSGIDPAQLFEAALRKVDLLVRDEAFITVRVAPTHESAVRQAVTVVWANRDAKQPIKIVADENLSEGACVIDTAAGVIEAGIESQIEALLRALDRREA